MALPSTGGEYSAILQPSIIETAVRKGTITNVLVRDYNGASTDLSADSVGLTAEGYFSPFADDGLYRDDLLTINGGVNLGFYSVGALAETGVQFTPKVNAEDTMIAQSRRSVRVDITKEDIDIKFTARESNPVVDFLRADKPLLSLPDLGKAGYAVAAPAEGDVVERQIILLMEDGNHRAAMILPRAMRVDVGDTAWNKRDPDDLVLTYRGLMCPFAGYPWVLLREGSGWRGLGGYPDFGLIAPVATAGVSTGLATVAHAVPTGVGDPWTYVVESAATSAGPWTTATVGSATTSGGTITHHLTGVTAGSRVFRVTATGSNELSATSSVSNSITVL